ncbi:MAG: DEAD/DEAH box helicase [Treponema sp.]|nr:DEAD/DEAH box helicase [Treponema sp.]
MNQRLSFQKISDLWQDTSAIAPSQENNICLDDLIFNIDLDEEGRALFFLTNKKGIRLSIDEIQGDNSPLVLALERIRQQKSEIISWRNDDDSSIYLDQNAELAYQLFKGERSFIFRNKIISNSCENERSKIVLSVIPAEETSGDFLEREFLFSLLLKTEQKNFDNPQPLTPTYALCSDKIFKTRDSGINYNKLSFFSGTVLGSEVEPYLSLFASIFPSIKIEMAGWSSFDLPQAEASPALSFQGLDEEGNLAVKLLWEYEPFDTKFISENKPATLVRLNVSGKSIAKIPLLYDGEKSWKKMSALLKNCLTKHPECKEEEGDAFVIDGDMIYISSSLALAFLSENLGDLAQNYKLYGTDALKKYRLKTATPKAHLRINSGIDFFDTECSVEIDGQMMTPGEFVKLYEENKFIPLSDGSRAIIDKKFFLHLKRLLDKKQSDGTYRISFFDMPLVDGLINARIENAENQNLPWKEFFSGFNKIQNEKFADLPVTQKLRDYQKYGLQWLSYITRHNLGACLADDMGLGKTIQTISLLASVYAGGETGLSLIVVPKSLIDNWMSELNKFAPDLTVYAYYGGERNLETARNHQVILTSYAVARNDIEALKNEEFAFIILDEVQQIKNTSSQASRAVMLLNAKYRVALSGTPMENNLSELYSIFRFLNPSMFGSESEFNRKYAVPIQKEGDEDAAKELSAKIRPFILRRLKEEVAKELPERTEQVIYVDMTPEQALLYEKQRAFYQKLISGEIAANGFDKSQFCILQGLTELRQIATVPESKTDGEIQGAKWQELVEKIMEISASGHRCLVFTNFLASIDAMSSRLSQAQIPYLLMTGATQNRAELVNKFQADESYKVFLMTLKTGGVGLNLTGADYVFILDPWWNRSAEQQAIDRTHRIGQTRPVFCYRLIARGTIEEKIMMLQQKKSDLFSSIISSDGQQIKKLSEEDINYLLRG